MFEKLKSTASFLSEKYSNFKGSKFLASLFLFCLNGVIPLIIYTFYSFLTPNTFWQKLIFFALGGWLQIFIGIPVFGTSIVIIYHIYRRKNYS